MKPKDVYTDPRIVNSINSALERGYRVVDFRTPEDREIVLFQNGTLRRFRSGIDYPFPPLLIWDTRRFAHDILEGRF